MWTKFTLIIYDKFANSLKISYFSFKYYYFSCVVREWVRERERGGDRVAICENVYIFKFL